MVGDWEGSRCQLKMETGFADGDFKLRYIWLSTAPVICHPLNPDEPDKQTSRTTLDLFLKHIPELCGVHILLLLS